ncbi:DNA-processing protein DprA [Proteiniclasticum sp. C24MP]|uniref:DNA-processing protein DprA n=1 Tax=Proteiniclasticum sp. C24MP TaxID=3374101 RepID=UPI00375528BF
MHRETYENIDGEQRLMAALHSSEYRKCHQAMVMKRNHYSKEEKARIARVLQENRNYVLIGDEDYPGKLYDMQWPPLVLFYEGQLELLKRPSIGMVGARNCSAYGRRITADLAGALAKTGFVIISGGAAGIDAAAHKTTLEESGKTVCVLGCALDISYPRENEKLFSVIKKEGLVLTEYPKGFGPKKWTFPMRNRIIAALSDEIIVAEATEKSGSLHTASYGEELNRTIHAIPHEVYSASGAGTNLLIEMGAHIIIRKENLLYDLLMRNPEVLLLRIRDLNLLDLKPTMEDLEKIFCLNKVKGLYWKEKLETDLNHCFR